MSGPVAVAMAVAVGLAAGAVGNEAPAPADLAVELSAPRTAELGEIVAVTIRVRNNGPGGVEAARVAVTLAGGVRLRSTAPAACSRAAPVVCSLDGLAAGSATTLTLPVRSDAFGTRTFEAAVSADAPDPEATNDRAQASVDFYVLALRALRVSPPRAGGKVVTSATLVRTDTGAPVVPGSSRCGAGIREFVTAADRRKLVPTRVVHGSRISCSYRLPVNAHRLYFAAGIFAHGRGDFTAKLTFWRWIP